jgi:ribosomal protein S12 methylthiotransferase accessory factor
MITLQACPKAYTKDQDKAFAPAETVARVKKLMAAKCRGVLAETERVDTGRLGIPVFVSTCGPQAAQVMPTRKQMGKGASPDQAEASALMELVERFSFFTFWEDDSNFEELTWSEAQQRWPGTVIGVERMLQSVGEELTEEQAVAVLDLVAWKFHPALNLATESVEYVPLDWFKKLNEFNGSSAGNTFEESLGQGLSELVERHVCCRIDRERMELPTIDLDSCDDPVFRDLVQRYRNNGITIILKDFSLGFPVPTVGALAYDEKTFPALSEIVFTAGTAASPLKAAVRALTEVAQLAGDFETSRVYEASGLPKFTSLDQVGWLEDGPIISLDSLPTVEDNDILVELRHMAAGLKAMGFTAYGVDTTHPDLGVTANYGFVPGFDFRERTPHASLGMFVGRMLAEDAPIDEADHGLDVLETLYPDAHFLPFFRGLLALRMQDPGFAAIMFEVAEPLQPAPQERALAAFYAAYAMSLEERWDEMVPHLDKAIAHDDEVKEYFNLRGVARFKAGEYQVAAEDFEAALAIDSGSPEDLANLGLCHKLMGHSEQARDYLEAALGLNPELQYARDHLEELI